MTMSPHRPKGISAQVRWKPDRRSESWGRVVSRASVIDEDQIDPTEN